MLSANHITTSFCYYSLSQAITAIVGFIILSVYTKLLEPSEFGKVSIIWVFINIVSILIDGRLNTAFSIKYYKSSREENVTNIYSIFLYNLIVYSIFFFVFLSFPWLFESLLGIKIIKSEIYVIFLLILVMIFGNFYTNFLMISRKPKSFFIVLLMFNAVLIISSLVYLFTFSAGYISYLKAYTISYLILSLLGLRFFISTYKPRRKMISCSNLKKLLNIGLPLVPDALLLMLLVWADRYVLNLYSGLTIVGIYSAGYRFSELINNFVLTPFGQAMSPTLFEQYTKSMVEYKRIMGQILKYYWLVILSITIVYFVFLKEVYMLFIGGEYLEGYNIIGIVLLGIIIGGAANLLSATLIMKEKTKYVFLFTSISVFLNIGLNFIIVPTYGMYGASIATLLSYILQFILIFYYTQKLVYIKYDYSFIFKSTFCSLFFLILVILVSYLNINSLIRIGLKATLFLLFIMTTYSFKDLRYIWKRVLNYVSA